MGCDSIKPVRNFAFNYTIKPTRYLGRTVALYPNLPHLCARQRGGGVADVRGGGGGGRRGGGRARARRAAARAHAGQGTQPALGDAERLTG
jgi:hypothetical protein